MHKIHHSLLTCFSPPLNIFDDVKVATNDYAEQQIVLGKGASRITSRELKLDLENAKSKIKEKNTSSYKKIQRIFSGML